MPKQCVEKLMERGMSRAKAHKACYPGQKGSSTKQEEQDKVCGIWLNQKTLE